MAGRWLQMRDIVRQVYLRNISHIDNKRTISEFECEQLVGVDGVGCLRAVQG